MMKFFRTHTKHLLAFFMALLLIVWLLGDIIDRRSGSGDGGIRAEWGEVYGETVSPAEIAAIGRSTDILEGLHRFLVTRENPEPAELNWSQFWGRRGFRPPLQLREWYMLNAEARRRGIHVPAAEVAKLRAGLPPQAVVSVRQRNRASLEEIDAAIESWLRVWMSFVGDLNALKLSEADIQAYVRDTGEKAKVKLAVLDASKFEELGYQPTEEELRQQFEKYKDVDPGQGEDGYGYRLPEEVQIEYIQVKADALADRQVVDVEDAHEYWKREMMPTATQPGEQPTTSPAKPYLTFTEAREEVLKKLRREKAKQEALRIGTEMAKALNAPWVNAPTTQPGNFKQPPEEAIYPNPYNALADTYVQRFGAAVSYVREGFLSKQDLYQKSPLSSAQAMRGSQDQIPLVQAAFLVPGIDHTEVERKRYARWFHNLYETISEPFVDSQDNVYVFRALGVKPKRPAENWQGVKNDKVRADLKAARGAKLAKERAEQLAERARQVGLEQAVKEDVALLDKLAPVPATQPGQPAKPRPEAVKTPAPFARMEPSRWGGGLTPTQVPDVGYDSSGDFVKTVFAMAGQTTTQPVNVTLYALKNQKRWVVVEFVELLPVTQEEFSASRRMAESMVRQGYLVDYVGAWLDGKNIRARVGYVPKYPEEDNRPDEERM